MLDRRSVFFIVVAITRARCVVVFTTTCARTPWSCFEDGGVCTPWSCFEDGVVRCIQQGNFYFPPALMGVYTTSTTLYHGTNYAETRETLRKPRWLSIGSHDKLLIVSRQYYSPGTRYIVMSYRLLSVV